MLFRSVVASWKQSDVLTHSLTGVFKSGYHDMPISADSNGRAFELVPEGTPILPGQTRTLALVPKAENGQPAPQPVYPVKASGRLDWDKGSFKVDVELK